MLFLHLKINSLKLLSRKEKFQLDKKCSEMLESAIVMELISQKLLSVDEQVTSMSQ
jgi:hypothetical protein